MPDPLFSSNPAAPGPATGDTPESLRAKADGIRKAAGSSYGSDSGAQYALADSYDKLATEMEMGAKSKKAREVAATASGSSAKKAGDVAFATAPATAGPKPKALAVGEVAEARGERDATGKKLWPATPYTPAAKLEMQGTGRDLVSPKPATVASASQGGGGQGLLDRGFYKYLQDIQASGGLVAENPMFTKGYEKATDAEKAALIKDNPIYYKAYMDGAALESPLKGSVGRPQTGVGKQNARDTKGGMSQPPGGAYPLPEKTPSVKEAAAGVPDWLMKLGEVLQAGAAGAAGRGYGETYSGMRMAREAEATKAEKENAFYERMKQLELDRQAEMAAKAQEFDKWKALEDAGLTREQIAAEMERTKYATDKSAAVEYARMAAAKKAAEEAALGGAGDWKTAAAGLVMGEK